MEKQLRITGIAGLIGIALLGVFTLLHPLTYNPWDASGTFKKVSHHNFWVLDHIFIFVGLTLWLLAMHAGRGVIKNSETIKRTGSTLFVISLTIWIIIMTFEIGIVPILADAIEHHQTSNLMTLWFTVFGFGLLAGYIAFIFTWLGVCLYSLAMINDDYPKWFTSLGTAGGLIGAAGIVFGLLYIDFALAIVAVTSFFPLVWSLIFLIWMVRNGKRFSHHPISKNPSR